tara:strand:- start:13294 stop:14475 length:1182 start_codon:yes stop_codon:yes gene_type:complete
VKNIIVVAALSLLAMGCSHPIEIVGEGDVLSATGDRDCLLEEFHASLENCSKNHVLGDYQEIYTAVARPGWEFEGWGNYCADNGTDACGFVIDKKTVEGAWGAVMPPLKARFTRIGCAPSTTSDRYSPSSYDSCHASDDDLTGIWMVLSDYSLASGSRTVREWTQKQRSLMTITDNGDGTMNARLCNNPFDGPFQDHTIPKEDSSLVIRDARASADIELRVVDNVSMEGEHLNSEDVSVQSSVVSAVKILDNSPVAVGRVNIDYKLNGDSYSEKRLGTYCFSQAQGSVAIPDREMLFEGEQLRFVTEVVQKGAAVYLKGDIYIPVAPTDFERAPDIWLAFLLDDYTEIEAEEPGYTTAVYKENSANKVVLKASVIDEIVPANSATMGLEIILE